MADLEQLCSERLGLLGASRDRHTYLKEARELEDWIDDKLQLACSEDYGQDYERCQVGVTWNVESFVPRWQ